MTMVILKHRYLPTQSLLWLLENHQCRLAATSKSEKKSVGKWGDDDNGWICDSTWSGVRGETPREKAALRWQPLRQWDRPVPLPPGTGTASSYEGRRRDGYRRIRNRLLSHSLLPSISISIAEITQRFTVGTSRRVDRAGEVTCAAQGHNGNRVGTCRGEGRRVAQRQKGT